MSAEYFQEEDDDWRREQENDAEFDYLDMQTQKIKQSSRDKALLLKKKKTGASVVVEEIVKPKPSFKKKEKIKIRYKTFKTK